MLKIKIIFIFFALIICSCQKADHSATQAVENTELRSGAEELIFSFSKADLFYYPEYDGGALFLGSEEDELIQIIKLDGFFSGDHSFVDGQVIIHDKYAEIRSANRPIHYYVFKSIANDFIENIEGDPTSYEIFSGIGIGARATLESREGSPYSDVMLYKDNDGGDVYGDKVPCTGQSAIHKYCSSGGCGATSCAIGGGLGALTVNGNCQCRINCDEGYYACCKDCEGCSCFPKNCCDAKF